MGALGYITHTLASAVADDGTVAVSYPTGQTQTSLLGSTGGDLSVNDGGLGNWDQDDDPGVTFTFGASTITVTNKTGISWPAGATLRISFGDTPRNGSYNPSIGTGQGQVAAGGAQGQSQELTATGDVLAGVKNLRLNHASTIIAATIEDAADHQGFFAVTNTSASGTAAHTVTLESGTWNGANTIATLNAPAESLLVFFDAEGNGTIVVNTGSVALSGP